MMSKGERVRVMHFVTTTGIGGPDRQVLGHLAAVDRTRFEVAVYALTDEAEGCALADRAAALGARAFWRFNRGPLDWGAARELRSLLRDLRIDLLCAHGDKQHLLGLIAARRAGVPILGVVRGWTGATLRVKAYDWLDRRLLRRMDALMAVSHAQAHRLLEMGLLAERVAVVHNAVDVEHLNRETGPSARDELGLSTAEPLIISVGRLSPEKAHVDLIEAAALMRDEGVKAHFAFIGDGPESERLARAAATRGLGERVHLLGHRSGVAALLRGADCFALPSLTEGLPNAVLEAMAMGLPVVATAVGGVPELVADGETGALVPPADPPAMADALTRLIGSDAETRRRMGEAGRDRVTRYFSFEGQARMLEALYLDVIQGRALTPSRA